MSGIDGDVAGKLALVTGASGGIGAACARKLASLGCNLALSYSASQEKCEQVKKDLESQYPSLKLTMHKADMASADEIINMCKEAAAEHNQPILILIVNAGALIKAPHINDISIETFDYTMSVNVRGPFILCKTVVPAMQEHHFGRIVTISSIAGYGVGVNGAHYAASKGGLQGMARNLATRLGKDGISVCDVAPAMIEQTGMISNSASVPGVQEQIPLGRLGLPDEVANVVGMFIQTPYCTGESLIIAGGLTHL